MDQAIGHFNGEWQQPRHGPSAPIAGNQLAAQKNEAATFAVNQLARSSKLAQFREQIRVIAQDLSIEFRIAASEVERIHVDREMRIREGTELNQIRASSAKFVKPSFIVKTECAITGNSYPHLLLERSCGPTGAGR